MGRVCTRPAFCLGFYAMNRHESQQDVVKEQAVSHAADVSEAPEVPEKPKLAPNVEFIGEMRETGFEDRQWLIRRDDKFIQLTELLYRVAEHSDGDRTPDEIADEVTASTEWLVSADNVRQLVEKKLLPLGIIVREDHAGAHEEKSPERSLRSPLAVNMRQRLVGPRYIEPVTGVLQFLFAPLVLLPVLALAMFAHGWLYLIHGIGGGLREMILAPGLTLVVLGVVFVAGVFHEFGHAAGLRYGGGRVRGMGFGLYLIYPALYTDTTDSYRLGRWGRVRTDLGGFYFHLIFALGVIGLFGVTGWEFLLVAVLLINLDIAYQCLPFVRFDGYWTLADLTGIPDFFSQMGAFLKSIVPVQRWRENSLPNLKPWVKGVFVTYVLVTIPLLALIVALLIANLPGIVAASWDSLLLRVGEFSSAVSEGNAVGAALAVAQGLLLALQTLGITVLLYVLGRKIWEWSKPTPVRRITGTIIAGVVVALVAIFWSPLF